MSTTLNITLTPAMLAQYNSPNVTFQVYVFGNNDPTPMSGTGQLQSILGSNLTPTISVPLNPSDETIAGGKVYFVIQNSASPVAITQESDINWTNAVTNGFRFDSIEFTLSNAETDVVNLTSVEDFGFAMMLDVAGQPTASYALSAADMFTQLSNIGYQGASTLATFSGGFLNGQTLGAISPTTSLSQVSGAPGATVFNADQWSSYLTAMATATTWNPTISGYFAGGADANNIYHNAAYYAYEVSYSGGYYWLSPTAESQVQGYIRISTADLQNSIYSTLGNVEIFTSQTDTSNPYLILDNGGPEMNVGANNQWGAALAQFLLGFTAGYYGVNGQSQNSLVTDGINLNSNTNWDPVYAFGQNLVSGDAPTFMDPYAAVFFANSNSYGSSYSDALMSQYAVGGPQVTIGTSGGDVSTIGLTIFGDNETPSTTSPGAYTTPVIYNYIAPPVGGYDIVGAAEANPTTPRSIVLSFVNADVQLADDVPVTLRLYNGLDSDGNPQWVEANLGSPDSLWTTWNFQLDGNNNYIMNSDGSYQVVADPNAVSVPGSMTFAFLPTVVSGTAWYQVVVGTDGSATQKIFNLYTNTDSDAEFMTGAGDLAVDGLARVSADASTPNTFTVNFLYGTTSTVDSSLLTQTGNFTYYGAMPDAPVAGTLSAGSFSAASGQTGQVSNTITMTSGDVAFGWTGDNSDPNTSSWISGRTNKVNSLNVALLSFAGGSSIAPLAIAGDLDGQWTSTVSQQLGNGTYTVTMQEFSYNDTAFANALTANSNALNLTISLSSLDMTHSARGIGLVDDVTSTEGNWLSLETLSSSLSPEATLILYRVDGSGQMIDSEGNAVSSLSDATMAYVGSVHSDSGATLFNGSQMVYLGLGQELRFAVQTGANSINMLPGFSASSPGDGIMHVNVGGVQLSVTIQNTLDASDNLASVQRIYDLPMVYLTHGQELTVDVAGSASNTNQLHFVRLDIDFTTGALSVGGVAYGDTDAFHTAVLSHMDSGYSTSNGGGTFHAASDWTVSGDDGYYVPVLITQSGNIFLPGNGNSGGYEYIRTFGENTFGFEDLTAAQGSDFDYNDMVMRLVPNI